MTKRELLAFLQPFDDDIVIYRFGQDHSNTDAMYEGINAEYRIADVIDDQVSNPRLSEGDGFILID